MGTRTSIGPLPFCYLLAAKYSAISQKEVSDFCKRTNMVLFSIQRMLRSVAVMLVLLLVIMTSNHMMETREPMYTTLQEDGVDQSGAWRGKDIQEEKNLDQFYDFWRKTQIGECDIYIYSAFQDSFRKGVDPCIKLNV